MCSAGWGEADGWGGAGGWGCSGDGSQLHALYFSTREIHALKISGKPVTSGPRAAFLADSLCLVLHETHYKDVSSSSQAITHKLCFCIAKSKVQIALVFQ